MSVCSMNFCISALLALCFAQLTNAGCYERGRGGLCCQGRNLSCSAWEQADAPGQNGDWHLHVPNERLPKGYHLDEFFRALYQKHHIPYDNSSPEEEREREREREELTEFDAEYVVAQEAPSEMDSPRGYRRQRREDRRSELISIDVRKMDDGKWLLSAPFRHSKERPVSQSSRTVHRDDPLDTNTIHSSSLRLHFNQDGKFRSVEELDDDEVESSGSGSGDGKWLNADENAVTAASDETVTTNNVPEAHTVLDPAIKYLVINDNVMMLPAVISDSDVSISRHRIGNLRVSSLPPHPKSKLCYCDEICRTLHDCCQDYGEVCRITNCELTSWSGWSECRVSSDGGDAFSSSACGPGISVRQREVRVRPAHGGQPCGPLQEQRSCFKTSAPCSELMSEVALILSAQPKLLTENGGKPNNASVFLYENPKTVAALKALSSYVVVFEVKYRNRACGGQHLYPFQEGSRICVECRPVAQMQKTDQNQRPRCVGEGIEGKQTFWSVIHVKHCNGFWERVEANRDVTCSDSKYSSLPAYHFV